MSLIELLADRLRLTSGLRVCDIGCGYGATARYLAEKHAMDITGVTVSGAQAQIASLHQVTQGSVSIQLQDWLCNSFAAEALIVPMRWKAPNTCRINNVFSTRRSEP